LVAVIIGLLVVSELRRTWSYNSVELEFDLDCEGVLGRRLHLTELLAALIHLWQDFNFTR
jgi:hypothetical protein